MPLTVEPGSSGGPNHHSNIEFGESHFAQRRDLVYSFFLHPLKTSTVIYSFSVLYLILQLLVLPLLLPGSRSQQTLSPRALLLLQSIFTAPGNTLSFQNQLPFLTRNSSPLPVTSPLSLAHSHPFQLPSNNFFPLVFPCSHIPSATYPHTFSLLPA